MSNELSLPQVPEPVPDDPEDVSWALSTAEAMWARGDHAEGIKWVRRAAEAASEAEDDARALQLAKAAADLAGMIARMSRLAIDVDDLVPLADPAPPPVPRASAAPKPPPPKPASLAAKPAPTSVTKQVVTPSRPPARSSQAPPAPARPSQAPPAPSKPPAEATPVSPRPSQPPVSARPSTAPSRSPKPLGTNTSKPPSMRPGPAAPPQAKERERKEKASEAGARAAAPPSKRSSRRSRPTIEIEARSAEPPRAAATPVLAETVEIAQVHAGAREEATIVGTLADVHAPSEWDIDSTQNLTGDDFPSGHRRTAGASSRAGGPVPAPVEFNAPTKTLPRSSPPSTSSPPATLAGAGPKTSTSPGVREGPEAAVVGLHRGVPASGIATTQAVRVVVWRDGMGVHVAPAGTVVSAITVDAVLVALEPNTDLTAWLGERAR